MFSSIIYFANVVHWFKVTLVQRLVISIVKHLLKWHVVFSKPDDFISDQLPVCHVTFHVVVAPEFKLQSRDRVVIQFQHEHLGGYGCKKHVLVPVRTV